MYDKEVCIFAATCKKIVGKYVSTENSDTNKQERNITFNNKPTIDSLKAA